MGWLRRLFKGSSSDQPQLDVKVKHQLDELIRKVNTNDDLIYNWFETILIANQERFEFLEQFVLSKQSVSFLKGQFAEESLIFQIAILSRRIFNMDRIKRDAICEDADKYAINTLITAFSKYNEDGNYEYYIKTKFRERTLIYESCEKLYSENWPLSTRSVYGQHVSEVMNIIENSDALIVGMSYLKLILTDPHADKIFNETKILEANYMVD